MSGDLSAGSVSVPVKPNTRGFAEVAQREIEAESGRFHEVGKHLGGFITKGLGVAGLGIGIGELVKGSFEEVSGMQSVNAQLAAGIKSTGNAAGVSLKQFDELSESISKYSGQTQQSVGGAEKVLQTFSNIRDVGPHKIFDQATEAAANMAAKMGGDAASNAKLLGRALNDPAESMSSLTRRGIQFTDAQKESIKTMQASGNLIGAQGVILDQLQTKFGGAAKAAGGTFAGEMSKLKNAINELIGGAIQKILPALQPLIASVIKIVGALAPIVDLVAKAFTKLLDTAIKPILPLFTRLANMLGPLLGPIIKALMPVVEMIATNFGMLLKAVMPLIEVLLELLAPLIQLIGPILKPLLGLLEPLIKLLAEGLTGAVKFLTPIIIGLAKGIEAILIPVIQGIITVLGAVISFITDVFSGNWKKIWSEIVAVFTDIWAGMSGVVAGVVNGVIDIIDGVIKGINGLNLPGIKIGVLPHWNGQLPGLADGGTIVRGGSVIVGERGPEILNLPAGASVNPDLKSARGTTNITINESWDPRATARSVMTRMNLART